jgi:hypothetical protein
MLREKHGAMVMRSKILLAMVGCTLGLTGCVTLEQQLARRVGCNHQKLSIQKQINSPGYQQYNFTCEGQKYVCKYYPFHTTCDEDTGKKGVKEKTEKKSKS